MSLKIGYLIFPVFALIVMGCQIQNTEVVAPIDIAIEKLSETPSATLTNNPTETHNKTILFSTTTPTPEKRLDPLTLWSTGPHANTYDLGKGANTYCAKCHSPFNWDPKAQIGTAPNCVSCKLPAEKEPRVSKQNPLVPMADWKNINCKVCHQAINDDILPTVAWWNQKTGKYESASNNSEICNKCHADTKIMKHQVDLKDSPHFGMGCLDCHDPHSTASSCSNSGCHENVREPDVQQIGTPVSDHGQVGATDCGGPSCHISATQVALSNLKIHGTVHSSVACIACHASSPAQVGRSSENGAWGIIQTVEIDGKLQTYKSSSHEIAVQVDCTRCHFDGNPWSLLPVTGHEFGQ